MNFLKPSSICIDDRSYHTTKFLNLHVEDLPWDHIASIHNVLNNFNRTMARINSTARDNIMLIIGVNHTNLTHFFLSTGAALHSSLFIITTINITNNIIKVSYGKPAISCPLHSAYIAHLISKPMCHHHSTRLIVQAVPSRWPQ